MCASACAAITIFEKELVIANPRIVHRVVEHKAQNVVVISNRAIFPFWLQVTTRCLMRGCAVSACANTATPSELSPDRENEIHRKSISGRI
jgi:hypothetical protein